MDANASEFDHDRSVSTAQATVKNGLSSVLNDISIRASAAVEVAGWVGSCLQTDGRLSSSHTQVSPGISELTADRGLDNKCGLGREEGIEHLPLLGEPDPETLVARTW